MSSPERANAAEYTAAGYRYLPNFMDASAGDELLRWMTANLEWHREQYRMFGRDVWAPREIAWAGDPGVSYRYSGTPHRAAGWPEPLARTRDRVALETGQTTNFVLLNRYQNGGRSMGWHRDDERSLAADVAVVSLGAPRVLRVRAARRGPSEPLVLQHGSLLLIDRRVWHCVPKTSKPVGERISMTYRLVTDGPHDLPGIVGS